MKRHFHYDLYPTIYTSETDERILLHLMEDMDEKEECMEQIEFVALEELQKKNGKQKHFGVQLSKSNCHGNGIRLIFTLCPKTFFQILLFRIVLLKLNIFFFF